MLGALADAGLDPSITPVAILPLGTGNDMARATGWLGFGGLISRAPLKQRLLARLHAIACAPIVRLDRWRVSLRLKAGGPGAGAAAAALAGGGLPPAFSCEHNAPEATGRFFNYLSIGARARELPDPHTAPRAPMRLAVHTSVRPLTPGALLACGAGRGRARAAQAWTRRLLTVSTKAAARLCAPS